MTRREYMESRLGEYPYRSIVQKLSAAEHAALLEFVAANESLDSNAYAKRVVRWFLDVNMKPKGWMNMTTLAEMANSRV